MPGNTAFRGWPKPREWWHERAISGPGRACAFLEVKGPTAWLAIACGRRLSSRSNCPRPVKWIWSVSCAPKRAKSGLTAIRSVCLELNNLAYLPSGTDHQLSFHFRAAVQGIGSERPVRYELAIVKLEDSIGEIKVLVIMRNHQRRFATSFE